MELTYDEEICHDEIIKKLEVLKLLKDQTEHDQRVAKKNIDVVKEDIDHSIMFHIENLQKRGAWLKSHAEHIHSLMTASFEEKNQQMEERIILVTRNLESPNYEELNDIMDMSMPFLPETSLLTFSTTDTGNELNENIKSFGNITTTTQRDQTESFVFAFADSQDEDENDDDEIEIIKRHHTEDKWLLKKKSSSSENLHFDDGIDSCWLIQDSSTFKKDAVDMATTTTTTTTTGFNDFFNQHTSEWLITTAGRNSFENAPSTELKGLRIDDEAPLQSYLSKESENEDMPLQSYLHHDSKWNHDGYTYPKRSFLEHWDFMASQDNSMYLLTKDNDVISSGKDESEKCQWLYRKEDCKQNRKCFSAASGCEMFDKNWLHTANDW